MMETIRRRARILIVDDDRDLCATLSEILSGAGYDCTCVHDGARAVAAAHNQRPDGIILDIKMPAGDGFSVYNRLKLSTHTREIPVMFTSGYYDGEIMRAPFIHKPFDPVELIAHLKRLVAEEIREGSVDERGREEHLGKGL